MYNREIPCRKCSIEAPAKMKIFGSYLDGDFSHKRSGAHNIVGVLVSAQHQIMYISYIFPIKQVRNLSINGLCALSTTPGNQRSVHRCFQQRLWTIPKRPRPPTQPCPSTSTWALPIPSSTIPWTSECSQWISSNEPISGRRGLSAAARSSWRFCSINSHRISTSSEPVESSRTRWWQPTVRHWLLPALSSV